MSLPRPPTEATSPADELPGGVLSGRASKDVEEVENGHQSPREGGAVTESVGETSAAPVHTKDAELGNDKMPHGSDKLSKDVGGEVETAAEKVDETITTKTPQVPAHAQDPMESSTATLKPDTTPPKQPPS